jgi:hypothetical protein
VPGERISSPLPMRRVGLELGVHGLDEIGDRGAVQLGRACLEAECVRELLEDLSRQLAARFGRGVREMRHEHPCIHGLLVGRGSGDARNERVPRRRRNA